MIHLDLSPYSLFTTLVLALGAALLIAYPVGPAVGMFGLLLAALVAGCWSRYAQAGPVLDVDSLMPEEDGLKPLRAYQHMVTVKKQPQMILAMDQAFFDDCHYFQADINLVAVEDFLGWHETASALTVRERGALEGDENYRQVLPYVVVRRWGLDGRRQYLTYRRTKLVGESRLAGRVSVGFGGHIDAADLQWRNDSTLDLGRTILENARRELQEELLAYELGAPMPSTELDPYWGNLFITHNDGVQRVHLGVVLFLDVGPDVDLVCREAELETLGFMTMDEIESQVIRGAWELEVWSDLLLTMPVGYQPPPQGR